MLSWLLGAAGFFLTGDFSSDMSYAVDPSQQRLVMISWSAQGDVIRRKRTAEETGLLQNGVVQTVLICLTFCSITSSFNNFKSSLIKNILASLYGNNHM